MQRRVLAAALAFGMTMGLAHAQAPAATAPPPALPRGLYELSVFEKGAEKMDFSETLKEQFKKQGHDPIVLRMTFDLAPTTVAVRTLLFDREKDGSGSVCDAQLTVPIRFEGKKLVVPSGGKAEAQFIKVVKSVKKAKGKTTTNTTKDTSECNASIEAGSYNLSWRGPQLVLEGPDGGKLIFTPTQPMSLESDELAKQL